LLLTYKIYYTDLVLVEFLLINLVAVKLKKTKGHHFIIEVTANTKADADATQIKNTANVSINSVLIRDIISNFVYI